MQGLNLSWPSSKELKNRTTLWHWACLLCFFTCYCWLTLMATVADPTDIHPLSRVTPTYSALPRRRNESGLPLQAGRLLWQISGAIFRNLDSLSWSDPYLDCFSIAQMNQVEGVVGWVGGTTNPWSTAHTFTAEVRVARPQARSDQTHKRIDQVSWPPWLLRSVGAFLHFSG